MLSVERRAALALVDDVCAAVLERTPPLRFAEAESPLELEALFRFRCRTLLEEGWGRPNEFPDGLERDAYDERAVHLAGWDGEVLISTARLVLPEPGQRLPTEDAFGLAVAPVGQVVDFGRLVIERGYRGGSLGVLAGVLSRAWISIRQRGLSWFCAADTPAMVRLYRRMGFEIEILAPARVYWGQTRHPVLFDLAASAKTLVERWS